MPKKAFVGPLVRCIGGGCDRMSRYVSLPLCGKHEMRKHRYGDTEHITSRDEWLAKCRAAALAYKQAQPHVYKKRHSRHEHRVVAEEMLGRALLPGEIVHHKDGNKHNNDPSNLEVMTQSDHMRLHHSEMIEARKAKGGYGTPRKAKEGS